MINKSSTPLYNLCKPEITSFKIRISSKIKKVLESDVIILSSKKTSFVNSIQMNKISSKNHSNSICSNFDEIRPTQPILIFYLFASNLICLNQRMKSHHAYIMKNISGKNMFKQYFSVRMSLLILNWFKGERNRQRPHIAYTSQITSFKIRIVKLRKSWSQMWLPHTELNKKTSFVNSISNE